MWWDHPRRRRVLEGVAAGTIGTLAAGAVGTSGADAELVGTVRETNAPVAAGERLEVTAALENRGTETASTDARLVVGHDPETVDGETVTVDPDSSETITLGYETADVARTQQFPVRLEAGAETDERTVTVFGTDDDALAPIRPADDELEVRPGTPVFFEVATPEPLEPGDVEWEADDDAAGDLALTYEYTYRTGTGAYLLEPESTGTYDVRATPSTGSGSAETAEHRWSVRVSDDGRGQPTIDELVTDPAADSVVGAEDPVDVSLAARDDEGTLARAIWIEGQNHTIVDVADLSGSEDDATLTRENPGWIGAGYPTMARVVCADGRTSELVTDDGPEIRPPLAVDIVETNAPVDGGEYLEVTVEAENEGSMMMVGDATQDLELIVGHDPQQVDAETVSVDPGMTETVTLGYETYPVERDDEFPVRVEGADDADERTVTVTGTGRR